MSWPYQTKPLASSEFALPTNPASSTGPPNHPHLQERSRSYPQVSSHAAPNGSIARSPGYVHAQYANPSFIAELPDSFIAELPAPLPPAPPTSTPIEQLNEDALLARKLQQMEQAEAQAQSQVGLSPRASQYSPSSRTWSTSPSNQSHFSLPSQTHHFSHPTPADQAPEFYALGDRRHTLQATPSNYLIPGNQAPEVADMSRPQSIYAMPYKNPAYLQPSTMPLPPPQPPPPTDPTSISTHLEHHRQVPYPPQWILPPPTTTFYSSTTHSPKTTFLDPPETQSWHTTRPRQNPTPPSFRLTYKNKSNPRGPRFSWTMTNPASNSKLHTQKHTWTYDLKIDLKYGFEVHETLRTPSGKKILCVYMHAQNYDSLRFLGPDGRKYQWVTHAPVSMLHGPRYDALRHALFASVGSSDALLGQIVADHAFWDGFADRKEVHEGVVCAGCRSKPVVGLRWACRTCVGHDVCEGCRIAGAGMKEGCVLRLVSLPDEVLWVRSAEVDVGLVVATLQVMRDWERIMLGEERRRDCGGFDERVERVRGEGDLGRASHWRAGDF